MPGVCFQTCTPKHGVIWQRFLGYERVAGGTVILKPGCTLAGSCKKCVYLACSSEILISSVWCLWASGILKFIPLPRSHDSIVQPRCKATGGSWPGTQQGGRKQVVYARLTCASRGQSLCARWGQTVQGRRESANKVVLCGV